MSTILKGIKVCAGKAKGEALVSKMGISFYGGIDPNTGIVIEKGHDLEGQSIAGKILVFPQGKGSTVGSYTMYRLKKNGKAPAAIINKEPETIVAVGAIISEIPCIGKINIDKIKQGSIVEVDAEKATVTIQ